VLIATQTGNALQRWQTARAEVARLEQDVARLSRENQQLRSLIAANLPRA
jgi:hypothetical protein